MDSLESALENAIIINGSQISDDLLQTILDITMAKSIVIFQGAGVSTFSGIPDFRSGNGFFSKYSEKAFEKETFLQEPEILYGILHDWRKKQFLPNEGHLIAKYLHQRETLKRVYTQNIDGLQFRVLQPPGLDHEKIIEFHGHLRSAECALCHQEYPIDIVNEALSFTPSKIARCEICQYPVKPSIILYGDTIRESHYHLALEDLRTADLVLIVGTSLKVYPFANLVKSITCPIIFINREIPENYPVHLVPRTKFMLGEIEPLAKLINELILQTINERLAKM